jgi:hypothetical protein
MLYRHTQPGIVILVVCLVIGALGAAMARQTLQTPMIFMLIILVAVAVVFHSLTVEISDGELRWHFGPGLWTYRLPTRRNPLRSTRVTSMITGRQHEFYSVKTSGESCRVQNGNVFGN